jgi:hypothetical protein
MIHSPESKALFFVLLLNKPHAPAFNRISGQPLWAMQRDQLH